MSAVERSTTRRWSGWPWSGPEIAVCCGADSTTRSPLVQADYNQLPAHLVIRAIGHDLQQPLHAMRMLVQELREAPSRLVLTRLADELQAGLEAMGNQLAFVIDGAQLDSGAHAPEQIHFRCSRCSNASSAKTVAAPAARTSTSAAGLLPPGPSRIRCSCIAPSRTSWSTRYAIWTRAAC